MADDLVLTPGGYRPRSKVHLIEPAHTLRQDGLSIKAFDRANAMVMDFGAIEPKEAGHPLMPHNVVSHAAPSPDARVPDLGAGWIVYADWTNNSGHPVSFFTTSWVVPPAPGRDSGQTVFLFNGIQNSTMIYQPVLQWGPSAAGGGSYWSVASWYADGQNGHSFHSSLQRVQVGQTLTGVMTLTGQSASGFSYNCEFTGIANTSLPIQNVQELTWCIQTLEAYRIQSRVDYPATCRTAMRAIELKVGNADARMTWSPVNTVTDTGQHCVVVSSASPGGEVDLFYSDSAILTNKAILGDTSPVSPAIASFNGRLYIAWKGDGNDHLNVAQAQISGSAITGFVNKAILGDTSPLSPALASFNGRLFIAWKGDGNDNLNLMYSTDNGRSFGHKYISPETTVQAPSLCVHNGNLYIAWKGDGNDHLNVALVQMAGDAIHGFVNKAVLGDTSPASPSLASFAGRLYIGWKGDGNDYLNAMYSTDNGHTFGHKMTSNETSPRAPGLGVHAGNLFMTWKGDGNDNLNVALVQNCG